MTSFTSRSPSGESGNTVEVVDVPGRRSVTLEPFTKSVLIFHLSADELRQSIQSQKACEASGVKEQLPERTGRRRKLMFGRELLMATDRTASKTALSWVAPDLDCYPLEEHVTFSNGSHNDSWLVGLDVGTPPESLFEIPPDYTERSPLQIEASYRARYPGHRLWDDRMVGIIEQRYQAHQGR